MNLESEKAFLKSGVQIRKPSVAPYIVLLIMALIFAYVFASVGYVFPSLMVIWISIVLSVLDYRRKYKAYGVAQSCPSCKAPYAEHIISREELNRKSGYETVPRFDTTTGTISTPGSNTTQNLNTTTTRYEQVHMTYMTYLNYLRCPFCGHQWTKVSTSKFEG